MYVSKSEVKMKKKNTIVFIDYFEDHSFELLKQLVKSKLFFPRVIICRKKTPKNLMIKKLSSLKITSNIFFENKPEQNKKISLLTKKYKITTGFIFSYPFILNKTFIKKFKFGLINCHPAIISDIKGSHSAFWTIFKERKIGCSIHFLNSKIDSGAIIDTHIIKLKGLILADEVFSQSRKALKYLLKKNLKKIWQGRVEKYQNKSSKIYFKKNIHKEVNLKMNRSIKIKKLFNILRATHINDNGIFFLEKGKKYKLISNLKEIF